jgi:hypothetical protein
MKTQSLIQKKEEFIKDHQLKIGGLSLLIVFIFIALTIKKMKENKLKQFLHSLDLTETNHKTQKIIYPIIIIKKDKIIINNSHKINKKTLDDNRDAFEKFFQINILDIEDSKQKTIIYYQK